MPVAIAALEWVLVALFVLVVPSEAFVPDAIVVGMIGAGACSSAHADVDRKVLETEAGDADIFTNWSRAQPWRQVAQICRTALRG